MKFLYIYIVFPSRWCAVTFALLITIYTVPFFKFQPLNEREPPMEPSDFDTIAEQLHKALRIGATQALKDGKIKDTEAQKYFWSGMFTNTLQRFISVFPSV